jgi:excisionase family DNA binding protein
MQHDLFTNCQIMLESAREVNHMAEVLTLEELADYLRLPIEIIERQASQGQIPGRRIEDTWRFLKASIDDWLRTHDGRTILLQQVGALSDDESLADLRAAIYTARGRSETED